MNRHDPLFKDLFRAFFRDLLRLADPDPRGVFAKRLGKAEIQFLDKEILHSEGRRHEVDLLVEVPPQRGSPAFLVHVEIERRFRTDFGRRLARYSRLLHLRQDQPVVSIVVFLQGGPPGACWIERSERVLGLEIGRLRYLCLGLSGLRAKDLLDRSEPLAWALASLANPEEMGRVRLKIEILRKIAKATMAEEERFQLTNCVETYLQLTGLEANAFFQLRQAPGYQEVEAMQTTWAERMEAQYMRRGMAKGLKQGMEQGLEQGLLRGANRLRATLLRQIEQRFGAVPPHVTKRIEAIASLDQLGDLADRILEVRSLEELGLGK